VSRATRLGRYLGVAAAVLTMLALPSTAPGAPPTNDGFANAKKLRGFYVGDPYAGDFGARSVEASKEAGEPNHAGNAGGASVWYSWTARRSRRVEIETCGAVTNFNTVLAVYTRSGPVPPFSNLTAVASNDDFKRKCGPRQSRVMFNATAGTTYYIVVDGFDGQTGRFDLWLYPHNPVGYFLGRTSQGERIGFRVSANGRRIQRLRVRVHLRCRIGGRSRRISDTLRQARSDVIRLRNRRFRVRVRARGRGVRVLVLISGRHRFSEWEGRLRFRVSGPAGTCDTGRVKWRA